MHYVKLCYVSSTRLDQSRLDSVDWVSLSHLDHNSRTRQRLLTFLWLHGRTQTRLHVRVGGWGVAQTLVCVCQTQDRRVLEVSASHHHADGQVWLTAAESSVDCQCRVSCGVRCKRVVRVSRILTQVFCTQSETRCMLTAINADSFTTTTEYRVLQPISNFLSA